MIIILLGYMGSGKSTIGRLLAEGLAWDFKDLDAYIEEKEGMRISEIFETQGEIYFRRKEASYLNQILDNKTSNLVLALGGGTPCYANNMNTISDAIHAKSIYLKLKLETLVTRLNKEKSQRPILSAIKSGEDLKDFIRKHLFERAPYYEMAKVKLNVDSLSPREIVEQILLQLY